MATIAIDHGTFSSLDVQIIFYAQNLKMIHDVISFIYILKYACSLHPIYEINL